MPKDLAIVLSNGGVSGAVVAALAAQQYRLVMLFGEGPGPRARAAYEQQVAHFKPFREHSVPAGFAPAPPGGAGSSAPPPDPRQPRPIGPALVELLPLLGVASRHAAQYGATAIFLGSRVGGDGDDLARATEFFQIWTDLLQMPCGVAGLEIKAPLLELERWQIVDLGVQAGALLDRTWSCQGDGPDPCRACRGCKAREAAFVQAAKPDPMMPIRKL